MFVSDTLPFNFYVNAWIYIDGGHVLGVIWSLYCKRHGCSVWLYMYAECNVVLFLQKKRKKLKARKKDQKKVMISVGVKQRSS